MIAKRVQEKIDSEKFFEPKNNEAQKRQKGVPSPLHPALLAWQAEFRTFDWGKAIGDLDTVKKEIGHLLSRA